MPRSPTDITKLYAPQFEQFGLELRSKGPTFTGEVANDRANGRAWIMPISPTCLVMEHFITPTHDMHLTEYTPEPYACVSEISGSTLACMPDAGITPANLKPLRGPWPNSAMCSFIQDNCGEKQSPLFAGQLYHSRSVLFLPGFFNELESRYPTELHGSSKRSPSRGTRKRHLPSAVRFVGSVRSAPARWADRYICKALWRRWSPNSPARTRPANRLDRQLARGQAPISPKRWPQSQNALLTQASVWASTSSPIACTRVGQSSAPPSKPKRANP